MKQSQFLHVDTNSQNLKVQNFFSWAWSKYGLGQSRLWTKKLTVSEEWTGGITDFLHVYTDLQKLKADQSKMGLASLVTGLKN